MKVIAYCTECGYWEILEEDSPFCYAEGWKNSYPPTLTDWERNEMIEALKTHPNFDVDIDDWDVWGGICPVCQKEVKK
jgi:hypothetical protein